MGSVKLVDSMEISQVKEVRLKDLLKNFNFSYKSSRILLESGGGLITIHNIVRGTVRRMNQLTQARGFPISGYYTVSPSLC